LADKKYAITEIIKQIIIAIKLPNRRRWNINLKPTSR
jgi:hypothetical protein